jgi:hypothetical protein|tara:strand:+ start:277 stop:462 length:186 start_codon:yes stop_codon:yes gene_type:complete
MVTKFTVENFTEFMYLISDFDESLTLWQEQDSNNTWDMNIYIGKGEYYIEIELNESNNKSK